ncbi:MAG: type IX secretion system sortase PorU [Muribaculaceae bacterium]|nr:type IX secretion system sortase PorU [Muribaculaceae bacterium]
MRKLITIQLACVVMMAMLGISKANAFSPFSYALFSKLAQGKWVKISIPEDGMYEITYAELQQMGFSNPDQVKVYGTGGHRISELLDRSAVDDLKRVPILRKNNKICFYGNGPVAYKISDVNTAPHFTRVFNPYSQVGCYFLTEESSEDTTPELRPTESEGGDVDVSKCLSFFIHENELVSISKAGKDMLGEDILTGKHLFDYHLPGIADSTIVVNVALSAKSDKQLFANAIIHSGGANDTTVYTSKASCIYAAGDHVYYNTASPFAALKLTHPNEDGQLEPFIKTLFTDSKVTIARLDYFILTYKRENVIRADENNQLLMGYAMTNGNERFLLPGASSNVVVWNIDNTNMPQTVSTTPYNEQGSQGLSFTSTQADASMYVAFDPTKTLKKISAYESVPNQNLHAMKIPALLIITCKEFMGQADRLANLHRAVDGIDVAVVDQEQIFNEFSSGTREGMAYRLFIKMLYDCDDASNRKFKNVLLFGPGTFDNREILGKHPYSLLTYECEASNYEDLSYTTDDFFGFLDDGSGGNHAIDKLRVGIGRITCADLDEARSDVDKIIEYYANPDYGVWRNNVLITSDSPDKGQYMYQGEEIKDIIDGISSMHVNTVHNSMYPRALTNDEYPTEYPIDRRPAYAAKRQLTQFLKDGSYFATYIGHAGPAEFSKYNDMWNVTDVMKTTYPHWPVMSTACCDVAHFDGDSRGIAELMFHSRNGGAIALLTSSRMVYANSNDQLNRYFVNALYSYGETGRMLTVGEAYKKSKLSFTVANSNKLSLFLLGDPAIRFNYPVSRFNITKVNGTALTDSASLASINPLSEFEIEASVVDGNGQLDQTFNGDATLTLYDKEDLFTELTVATSTTNVTRDIYFNRPKLAEISGRVTNGVFKGMMIAPKEVLAKNEAVLLRSYAHKDDSDYMVNGATRQVTMLPFDESMAIQDNEQPVITSMFINDEQNFTSGSAIVGSNGILYITATDDQAIDIQDNSVQYRMTLLLDGGKTSYGDVASFASMANGGKTVNVEFPLKNMTTGMHSLTYTVYDIAGNFATRTISFVVGINGTATLVADKWPAYQGDVVKFDLNTDMSPVPDFTVRVTDATGNLVWKRQGVSFPVMWDMKDMDGNQVPAGLYRFFGTYSDGTNCGGTPIEKLIVLEPLKTAQ